MGRDVQEDERIYKSNIIRFFPYENDRGKVNVWNRRTNGY